MAYLLAALGIIIAAGGVTAAIAFPTVSHERDTAKEMVALLKDQLQEQQTLVAQTIADAKATAARYEATIANLKLEINKLAGELDVLATPMAVRSRLLGLFPLPPASSSGGPKGV